MKHRVTGRVAHFHTDAVIGLDENQHDRRAHQLEALGNGRFRVIGPHVSFKYGEVIDVIDVGHGPNRSAVLEAIGNAKAPAGVSDEMRAEADALSIRYGYGIGAQTLGTRIAEARATKARIEAQAGAADTKAKAEAIAARKKAAKARR